MEQIEDPSISRRHDYGGAWFVEVPEKALKTLMRHVRSGGLTGEHVKEVLDAERMWLLLN